MEYIGYFCSILIGLILGLIGGGGSILTMPVLVYLFDINPENATSYSLFVVGVSALVGAYRHYKLGNLKIKPALIFAFPSVISLLLMRKIVLPMIPQVLFSTPNFFFSKDLLIMMVFAILMIAASVTMIKKTKPAENVPITKNKTLAVMGFAIGLIIGFLGAGGGFLIIPALLFFANLKMKEAVGTSLLIIFINAAIGFSGDVLNGAQIDYKLLFTISGIAIIGMLIGTTISKKIDGAKLKPAFGWFVLVMGIYIMSKEIFFS